MQINVFQIKIKRADFIVSTGKTISPKLQFCFLQIVIFYLTEAYK